MNNRAKAITEIVLVVLGAAAIISGIIFLIKYSSQKKQEGFCGTCQGIGNMSYPDIPLLNQMYNSGELTEFSDRSGPRAWDNSNSNNNFQSYKSQPKTCM